MFDIRIGVVGHPSERLRQAAKKIREVTKVEMRLIMNDIWRSASANVSGRVLKVRSGHLRRSLGPPTVRVHGTTLEGMLGAKAVYARIHEEGGTIPAHTVRPRHAKALRFLGRGGQLVFAKKAEIPAVRITARPFLRPAFDELAAQAPARLRTAAVQAFNEA